MVSSTWAGGWANCGMSNASTTPQSGQTDGTLGSSASYTSRLPLWYTRW